MKPLIKNQESELFRVYPALLKLLSRIYLEAPDYNFIHQLYTKDLFKTWPALGEEKNLQEGKALLKIYFKEFAIHSMERLTRDYYRLFVGFDTMLAPPYESVYLSDQHILFDPITLKVRECYRKHGLTIKAPDRRPDDHIGYELAFLSLLCDGIKKSPDSAPEILTEMKAFLDSHLLKWIGLFVQRIISYGKEKFFKGVALLTWSSIDDLRILLD